MKSFDVIAAADEQGGIGKDGKTPWHIPGELRWFREVTTTCSENKNAVIMGRVTWESLPNNVKPLKGRVNIVVTASRELEGAMTAKSLQEALDYSWENPEIANVIIIGGALLYKEALLHPNCGYLVLSVIPGDYGCDKFIEVPASFKLIGSRSHKGFTVNCFVRGR